MKTFLLSLTLGLGTLGIGYAVSVGLDRRDVSDFALPASPLGSVQASPIDAEKMRGFRRGMGFAN